MRRMSCAMTQDAVRAQIKNVTRRKGWVHLQPGTPLRLVTKTMGLRKGEHAEELGVVEVVDIRREPLGRILEDREYGRREVTAEGFPGLEPEEFIDRFFTPQGIALDDDVTRIEWRYLDQEGTA